MKVTLEELRVLVTVADCGSITSAAELLDQTSSGVSRALSRLEAKLNSTLLHRTTRRLALTEEGQLFLTHARQICSPSNRRKSRSPDAGRRLLAACASTPPRLLCSTSSCR